MYHYNGFQYSLVLVEFIIQILSTWSFPCVHLMCKDIDFCIRFWRIICPCGDPGYSVVSLFSQVHLFKWYSYRPTRRCSCIWNPKWLQHVLGIPNAWTPTMRSVNDLHDDKTKIYTLKIHAK